MDKKIMITISRLFHDMAVSELKYKNSLNGSTKLTFNDILYMDIIAGREGKYTATQIADLLMVSRPSVTQKINELVKKGYVIRKQDENDKRIYYLYINEETYSEEVGGKLEAKIAKELLNRYSKEDLNKLCDTLSVIGELMANEEYN